MEKNVFENAQYYSDSLRLSVVKFYLVKDCSKGKSRENQIFILSTSHFCLFNQKHKTCINLSSWKNLKFIDCQNLRILFTFKDDVNFQLSVVEDNINHLFTKILAVLYRVLTPTEINNLQLHRFNFPYTLYTPRSPLARFYMWRIDLQNRGYRGDQIIRYETEARFLYSLAFKEDYLDLKNLPDLDKFLPVYIDALKVAPQVKQLKIPLVPNLDAFQLATDLVKENQFLKFIEIAGICDNKLRDFLIALRENKNSKILGLSFAYSQFKVKDLQMLYEFIINSPIHSLEFHAAFKHKVAKYFYSSFLTPKLCDQLSILNLGTSVGIELDKLFPKIRSISMLSLDNCNIDLGETLNSIINSSLFGLQVLDISNAVVRTLPDQNLPPFHRTFTKLIINNVRWPAGSLSPFFEFLFSHFNDGLSLYFSDEIASNDEWNALFKFIDNDSDETKSDQNGDSASGNHNSNDEHYNLNMSYCNILQELAWNNNPVKKAFLNFLGRQDKLTRLELDGCFNEETTQSEINSFCDYIMSFAASRIKTLSIKGNKKHHFGVFTSSVLESLYKHKSLESLDISSSFGNDEAIECILPLCESTPTLKELSFNGMKLDTYDEFINTMIELHDNYDYIKVSYPNDDVAKYKSSNPANQKEINKMAKKLNHMYQDPAVTYPHEIRVEELCKPHTIYMKFPEYPFPSYVDAETHSYLLNIRKQPLVLVGHQSEEKVIQQRILDKKNKMIGKTKSLRQSKIPLRKEYMKKNYYSTTIFKDMFSPSKEVPKNDEEEEYDESLGLSRDNLSSSSTSSHNSPSSSSEKSDTEIQIVTPKQAHSPFMQIVQNSPESDSYSFEMPKTRDVSFQPNASLSPINTRINNSYFISNRTYDRQVSNLSVTNDDRYNSKLRSISHLPIEEDDIKDDSSQEFRSRYINEEEESAKRAISTESRRFKSLNPAQYNKNNISVDPEDPYKSGPSKFKQALIPRHSGTELETTLKSPNYILPHLGEYNKTKWSKYNDNFALDGIYASLVEERRKYC